MSVLKEIQQWAPSLPFWQQDAIVRLFSKDELDIADYDDLYALLKTEQGIVDPQNRTAKTLGTSQVAAAPNSQRLVQLAAIKNLRNVNALAENQTIPFNLTGLTVIYGDNGSGKSGYSRALKKACRARDREDILPDAKLPVEKVGKPEATFDLIVDCVPTEVSWLDGNPPPEQLADIAIFDAHCARSYIDAQDDYSYVPYGLDIFAGLAKACSRLKAMVEAEQAQTAPNTAVFASLSNTSTAVGKLLTALSAKTKLKDVEALALLSQIEFDRHVALGKSLKEGDPKEKAAQLKLRSGRISSLAERYTEKAVRVNEMESARLRSLFDASSAAKEVADLAARQFRETSGQLPGTGGEAWQILFEAARGFAVESHPGKTFPHLGPESMCPLCQQPLGEAVGRLVAFDAFIQQEAEKATREKRKAFTDAYQLLEKADLGILLDTELKAELTALNADLAESCEKFGVAIRARRDAIKAACNAENTWDAIIALPSDPAADLKGLANSLADEAATLEKAADGEARSALEVEFKELDARKQLGPMKTAVLETIAKLVLQAKLKACLGSVKTTTISVKSTELTQKIVSNELAEALNAEYRRLNVGELSVSLRSFAERGKTFHKLVLQLPGEQRPAAILSVCN